MPTSPGEFYKSCFRKAREGKIAKAQDVSGLFALIAVPFGLWIWPSSSGTMNWIPLILFAILFILFFLFGLITAPYRLVQEVESERDQLKKRLDNRAQRQAAMARLWALRAEGVNLRNRPVPEGGFGEWHQAYSNWRDRVLAEARVVSPNFEAWLDTLDRVRLGPALAPPLNDEHGRHRNNMSEMLLRMQEFLQAKMLNKDIENSAG